MAAKKLRAAVKTAPAKTQPKSEFGTTVDVLIRGIADLQFDRYTGKATEKGATVNLSDLLYLDDDGGLVMPADNFGSFFYSGNYPSCMKMFWGDMKTRGVVTQSFKAQVFPGPQQIPILDGDGEQIQFNGFKKNAVGKMVDKSAGLWVDETLPRVKGGVVPNPNKRRPTLRKPWTMRFQLSIFEIGRASCRERV